MISAQSRGAMFRSTRTSHSRVNTSGCIRTPTPIVTLKRAHFTQSGNNLQSLDLLLVYSATDIYIHRTEPVLSMQKCKVYVVANLGYFAES